MNKFHYLLTLQLWLLSLLAFAAPAMPFRIDVVDDSNGWAVPLIELRTTHQYRFITDNAGTIACDLPELMGREVWFDLLGHGYEIPKDGFGYQGVRLTPQPGGTATVRVKRTIIAKRLGRLTGAGIFAESQRLGLYSEWQESGCFGCDTVQNARFQGKLFWAWGDTTLAHYPLGVFHITAATTPLQPLQKFEPPLMLPLTHFKDNRNRPRAVARMPGNGPTWIFGCTTLPDASGKEHLVASYVKIKPPLEVYEQGLCEWNPKSENFEQLKVIWSASETDSPKPPVPDGHPALWSDEQGKRWVLFGNPFPHLRCPATFEAWQNPSTWEHLKPQPELEAATSEHKIIPHTGAIAWNSYRQRWVTLFMQKFGSPSAFGELWYAEAPAPTGPWGKAVKVLSHNNYTFYNPQLHPEITPTNSPILLFEGTYTRQFADNPHPTPRYDYNQILYRLDLDDPQLKPAH